MKRTYRTYLCSVAILLLATSCDKTIQLEPVSSISNASFWKTESDANGLMYGMYDRLRTEVSGGSLLFLGEGRSDVLGPSLGTGPNMYWENTLSRSNAGPTWRNLYTVVHHANLLLKYVPGIAFTSEANKNNVLAQAYAMRAYVYFVMVRTWGDLPKVTDPTEGYEAGVIQKERTSKEEIFSFIKQDIDQSLKLFSNNTFPSGRNVWSKPAVNTLKADIYLWTAKRQGGGNTDLNIALTALNEAETSDVSLLTNFGSVFDYTNKGNKEVLMAVRFQELESANNWATTAYWNPNYMSASFDPEATAEIGVIAGAAGGSFSVSELVRKQFTTDDQRRRATFFEIYGTLPTGARNYYGSFATKFNGVVSGGLRLFLDDIVIYRYADIILMKAEIKNALGQDPTAEMNAIRKRAYGTAYDAHVFVNGTKAANDAAILKERLFEFALEGKRWWDLVRFGQAFELVPSLQARKGQDYLLLFPISDATLSLENKVKQNPGYE